MTSFDNVLFDTKENAEKILNAMRDILTEYGFVTVADLYDLVGFKTHYKQNYYGWISLPSTVSEDSNGWFIDLKQPSPVV